MNREEEMKSIKEEQRKLADRLEALEKPEKWEPGGKFAVMGFGAVDTPIPLSYIGEYAQNGHLFTTQANAEQARDRLAFLGRLIALKQELEPGTNLDGEYELLFVGGNGGWGVTQGSASKYVGGIFKTHEAAEKACEILNRDGWTL